MSCILIGNGTSILNKKNKDIINSFDRVVRFNSYQIDGFEEFVGTKTTDWYSVRYFTKNNFRVKNNYEKAIIHTWNWNEKTCSVWQQMKDILSAKIIDKTKESSIWEMQKFLGSDDYYCFSTGAIATWEFLKEFNEVSLIGFDWWDKEAHHYADAEIRGPYHRPQIEKQFFQKLGKKVSFL